MTGGSHTQVRSSHRLGERWERLSTAVKMFLILTFGLVPLGVIAITASIENAQDARRQNEAETRALLAIHVQRITLPLARHAYTIRAARDARVEANYSADSCARTLGRLAGLPIAGARYALFGTARAPRCATPGYAVPAVPAAGGEAARVEIGPGGAWIRFFLYDPGGAIEGVAEFDRERLAAVANAPPLPGAFGIDLIQGERIMALRADRPDGVLDEEMVITEPLANGQYALRVHTAVAPVTLTSALIILTPVLMWLWASVIGWLLVQRLLLRPLARLQRAVSAYRPGDRALALPPAFSPATEIDALGRAFATMTQTVARHEADLEAGLEKQTKLVREVHHRVKNNLQVVASLLNIHSRGATDPAASAAYVSIQRRVDALAVVHRNHYAELEENRGVALRPLISELAANLRATAPAGGAMLIRVAIAPVYATQDTAVSVAFLVTEIAEFGMLCGVKTVSIAIERTSPTHARLTIEVDVAGGGECAQAVVDRFERVISGLARQLRSTLERDPEQGLYGVDFTVAEAAAD